jgi:hypothetical protein
VQHFVYRGNLGDKKAQDLRAPPQVLYIERRKIKKKKNEECTYIVKDNCE